MVKTKFVAYPILFTPIFKEKVWGGRNLETLFDKNLPKGKLIGESWEVSDRPGDSCKIRNGVYRGKDIHFLFENHKKELLDNTKFSRFPLLIKFIDSQDDLSVQVHPDDEYANKNESGEWGKTECWYVIDAKKNARIVYGLKEVKNKSELKKIVKEGKLRNHLNYVNVRKGDFIFMPAGTVHALLKGVVVAEIQQSSDLTYRLYDWDRKITDGLRPLHINQAIDVTNLKRKLPKIINTKSKIYREQFETVSYKLVDCKYFTVEKLFLKDELIFKGNSKFQIYTIISGEGKILYDCVASVHLNDELAKQDRKANQKTVFVKKGYNVIIPASLKNFRIVPQPKIEMLFTTF